MTALTDRRGIELEVGQYVAYGKSNRDSPIAIGVIIEITDRQLKIRSNGYSRLSLIPIKHTRRIIVLPEEYLVLDKLIDIPLSL